MVINGPALLGALFLNGGFILSPLVKPLRVHSSPVITIIHLIHHSGGQGLTDNVTRQEGTEERARLCLP